MDGYGGDAISEIEWDNAEFQDILEQNEVDLEEFKRMIEDD